MNTKTCPFVIVGCMLLALRSVGHAQTVVYDNTTTYLGTEIALQGIDLGNEITLAGTNRVLTNITIAVRPINDDPDRFALHLSLWTNDGPFRNGGGPGTLLWQSERIPHIIDARAPTFISFDTPNVIVPDTFIWILSSFSLKGSKAVLGLSEFYPPTVGSARPGFWRSSLGPPWLWRETGASFGARVTAAPRVMLDIDPGACPKVLNIGRGGPIKVAVVGTPAVDVWRIDLASLGLSRTDGIGGTVEPIRHGRAQVIRFKDVATPFLGAPCECHDLRGDGIVDRVLTFSTRGMVDVFELGSLEPGTTVMLTLTGRQIEGSGFSASDCVVIKRRGRR